MYARLYPEFWTYTFFTEHAIKHNHKPIATPPSTAIAATENHSLPPFASLALFPSPHPSIPSLSSTFLERGGGVHRSLERIIITVGIAKTTVVTEKSPCWWYYVGKNWTTIFWTTANTHWWKRRRCLRYGPRKRGGHSVSQVRRSRVRQWVWIWVLEVICRGEFWFRCSPPAQ